MRAVFRFDASTRLGAGHAYRCMTLARSLSALGWDCHAIVNKEATTAVPALSTNPALTLVQPDEIAEQGVDWLIVDHYGLDADWERGCRTWARNTLVIDDLADRPHDCDVLLDQTFERDAQDYATLVPANCHVLAGSSFALLRPEFAENRHRSLARRTPDQPLQRVFIGFGATDPDNHSSLALQAVAESGLPLSVDVAIGSGAPHLAALRNTVNSMPFDVRLHLDAENMAALMSESDLAIGAAGTSTWERCCLGLPSLLICIAENQREIAAAVAATGAAQVITASRDALVSEIASALRSIASEPARRLEMAQRAAAITDGRGCDRVGLSLVQPGSAKNGGAVTLRLADRRDENRVLEWQSHPTTRRFSRNPSVPSAAEHHAWFTARLNDPDCLLTLVCLSGDPAGVLRLDAAAPPSDMPDARAFEVSILTSPDHRGQGLALEALRLARRWQRNAVIIAEVLAGNDASSALFSAAGYARGEKGLLYSYPDHKAATRRHRDPIS